MSQQINKLSEDSWALDYIDDTVCISEKPIEYLSMLNSNLSHDAVLFSKLPGPSYNDTVIIGEEHVDSTDIENIIEITDPLIDIPKENMAVLNFMNHIAGNLHRKFKDLPIEIGDIPPDTIPLILRQLTALLRYTIEMCHRFQQVPIEHGNRSPVLAPQYAHLGELRLIRSSYKFCENSASCKINKCKQHHFVFNRLYSDILSLEKYIIENAGKWHICDATRSINTIYFVVSHMHHEQHAVQTVGIFNNVIASSYELQHTQADKKQENKDDKIDILDDTDWTEVSHKKKK